MLTILGLSYGAFDFIVDVHDQWHFLEVNPIGQWYWIEERVGLMISDEIVSLLIGESF